ncbi:MAG: lipoprotein [Verrucomicrobiia bacterium]
MKKILLLVPLLVFLAGCSPTTEEDTTAPAATDTTTNAPAAPAE